MASKIVFLGLDAADPDLILNWCVEGHLPNFSRLFKRGCWGTTENPLGLYVGAIWPSFSTSVSPARHTRYCYTQLIPGQYDSRPFQPRDLKFAPFWKWLGEQGKRVAVIDIPKTGIESINGIQIADWGTHDPEYDGIRSWPNQLANEVIAKFGVNPIYDCNGIRQSAEEFTKFRNMLTHRIQQKKAMISHFQENEEWDCLIASFSESHCVGHQCWHLHDTTHPRHNPLVVHACGNPMLDVYRALDRAVGELTEQAGRDCLLVLLASHGMGPHYEATYLLEQILKHIEKARYGDRKPVIRSGLKKLWCALPLDLKKRWQPARLAAKRAGLSPLAARRYFKIPNNDVFGGIRINQAGREPHGIVQPGSEFDEICDHLIQDLHTLVNAKSGQNLVLRVVKTQEHYEGEHLHYLPDLMVEWNRSAPISVVHSPLIGTIRGQYTGCRSGDHKANGLFIATGPHVRPGQLQNSVSVMDFGPTIAHYMGLHLPNVDGKPIDSVTANV